LCSVNSNLCLVDLSFHVLLLVSVFIRVAVSTFWAQFSKALGASQRVFELLDMPSEEQMEVAEDHTELTGKIEFRDV
jgi:ABC-type bacteriocin/lantibiotic exporter with double-glycine peptidase domain